MAARHTVIQTVIHGIQLYRNFKKETQKWYNANHKSADMANEFQISSLTELLDSFGDSTLYKLPTAIKRWCMWRDNDCRTTVSEQYNLAICAGVTTMIFAVCDKKYCSGFTLSLQQHEKIRPKQLFHATEIFCILLSFRCQTSQPYSGAGKQ